MTSARVARRFHSLHAVNDPSGTNVIQVLLSGTK
jgi:hypothetical protein